MKISLETQLLKKIILNIEEPINSSFLEVNKYGKWYQGHDTRDTWWTWNKSKINSLSEFELESLLIELSYKQKYNEESVDEN